MLLLLMIGAMLLLALLLGALALARGGSGRKLRERVRALSEQAVPIPATTVPSIRAARSRGKWLDRLLRFLHFNPDMPQEQVIPWPLVALLALGVAALSIPRLAGWTGVLPALPLGLLSGLFAARMVFGWQHARYCDAVFQQIPDALGQVVRGIRAGLPLTEALRGLSREMPSPSREEFARVVGDMAIGRPVEVALIRLHERTGLTEYAFLAVTLGLQSQTGGNLAETLENLADMVRKRVTMAKRAKALAAEAKMQAGILMVLPFVAALAMSLIQPFYIAAFTENPTGQQMAMIGLMLMLLGVLTIRWLIRQAGSD
ncbi:type II secretion system F family protein [Siccirubricoccus sp. KC 17139]|uniref:Type II secretion system F family protein n=1 Tax=Siccirubricoccus soli TaxID=2899147 RepID=A0ABT1DBB1_9PROT|nr:type II secretion system F family protein [Siccirubricoccus soli]MCO6419227.1 type II secretion system F family protein [Siccirubricoccus soli]MCP2685362.1 type II secretion system F family protein [Siccirubricoccus soli]